MHEKLRAGLARIPRGRRALAVLDVDLTLVDNAPRTRAIFADWLHSVRDRWPHAEEKAVEALTMPLVFGVHENLAALGVVDPALRQSAFRFWLKAFFSDDYCLRDVPLPGAVEAVQQLAAEDVTLCYLTARTVNMASSTTQMFQKFGFPVAVPHTMLVMKPSMSDDDRQFKADALGWLGQLGEPVLCADNEPSHVNTMQAAFPDALTVLVGDRHSTPAPEPHPAIIAVPGLADVILGERP